MVCGKCFRSCILFNHSFFLSVSFGRCQGPRASSPPALVVWCQFLWFPSECWLVESWHALGPNKNHEGFWNIFSFASKGIQGNVRLLFLWLWWGGGVVEQQGCVEPWVTWLKTQCCPGQVRIERKDRQTVFPLPTSFCGTGVVAGPWTCLAGALLPTLTSQPQN